MATKYAVASGLWDNTTTVWSLTDGGAAGDYVPVDDEPVIIRAGVSVQVNVTTNIIQSLLIRSDATSPGAVFWKNDYDGTLRIISGSIATNRIYGTTGNSRGRLYANYSGLWTGSTASATLMASQSGVTGTVSDGGGAKRIFTPAVSPAWVVDALIGESMTINGSTYAIEDNDATTVTLTTGPAIGATVTAWLLVVRPLPLTRTAKIMLGALSTIQTQYLDVIMLGTEPTNTSVRTYGQVFSEATITVSDNRLSYTGIGTALPVNTVVRVTAGSTGTLPSPLAADTDYWVESAAAGYITLKATAAGSVIDLTTQDTGKINVHVGLYTDFRPSTDNTLTFYGTTGSATTHSLANGVACMLRSSNGVFPAGLEANHLYYVVSTATTTLKLAHVSSGVEVDITSIAGIGTIDIYTGSTGALASGGMSATTNPYTSTMVNVLDDVTADTMWVATGDTTTFATCTTRSAAVLANVGPIAYDQQRVAIKTITAKTMTLTCTGATAYIDSTQFPNARIWLASRNVAIQCESTTLSNTVIDATSNTLGGVYLCEIRCRPGTGTTFAVVGFGGPGSNHLIGGIVSGCNVAASMSASVFTGIFTGCGSGLSTCNYSVFSGTAAGCNTAIATSTGVTFTGHIEGCDRGVNNSYACLIGGEIVGCSNMAYVGTDNVFSGIVRNCNYGANAASGFLITGTLFACNTAIFVGTGVQLAPSGVIDFCPTVVNGGVGHVLYGTIRNCATTFTGVSTSLVYSRGATIDTLVVNSASGRNTAGFGSRRGQAGIFMEDHGGALGASVAYHPTGTVTKQASVVRSGGAATAMRVLPLSECKTKGERGALVSAQIRVFEWTELDVPASAQTKSVYVSGSAGTAWSPYPTAAELFFEAEYLDSATLMTKAVATSTAVLTGDSTTWVKFEVTFTPLQAGPVRYRLILGAYSSATADIYVDNMLVTG